MDDLLVVDWEAFRAKLPYLRERFDVDRLGICDSYAREEQTDDSDLDLLVTFTAPFDFVGLKPRLEGALGLSVDLSMPDALKRDQRRITSVGR